MSEENIKIPNTKERKKKISEALDVLESELRGLEKRKIQIHSEYDNFHNDVVGDSDGKKVDGNLSILGDVKDSQTKITEYYNDIFSSGEGETGIEAKIDGFLLKIESVEKNALASQEKINAAEANVDNSKEEVEALEKQASAILAEVEKIKSKFDLFCQKIDEREGKIKAQEDKINAETEKVSGLSNQVTKLLEEMTDKSLHNAFKSEANSNKKGQLFYFWFSLIILIGGSLLFLHSLKIEVSNNASITGHELWLIRFFLAVPFGFAYWLCSSKAAIKMKLAEEYQHKASIAEALAGYREMWSLKHHDEEYQKLFNLVSSDLIKNPADKIKISHKDIFEKVGDTAKSVIRGVKEILPKEEV